MNTILKPARLVAPGGFGTSMSQLFGFGYPGYGGTLSLTLPVRNRGGQADAGQRPGLAHPRSTIQMARSASRLPAKFTMPSISWTKPARHWPPRRLPSIWHKRLSLPSSASMSLVRRQTSLCSMPKPGLRRPNSSCCRHRSITALLSPPSTTPPVTC